MFLLKSIDPFKGLSTEEVQSLFDSFKKGARSKAISKGVQAYYDSLDSKGYAELCERNRARWSFAERNKASERSQAQWAGYSKERKQLELEKVFLNQDFRDRFAEFHKQMSLEDRKEWTDRSFNSETRNETYRQFIKNMTLEEKSKYVKKWTSGNLQGKDPSEPEKSMEAYLDNRFPGEWLYNGSGDQGVVLGGKIPDFVNVNGKKSVIEVFGTYWHEEEEVEEKIKHYEQFGFDCKVIWEYDCYLWNELDKLFEVVV